MVMFLRVCQLNLQMFESEIEIPDGIHSLYFTFRGDGNGALKSFELLV